MPFPNRYPGKCVDCQAQVAASTASAVVGMTFFQNGDWVTRCKACADKVAPMDIPVPKKAEAPRIKVYADPDKKDHVLVKMLTILGEIKFAEFKVASQRAGCKYLVDEKTKRAINRAPISAIPQLITYMREVGIEVELDPSLARGLQQQADTARAAAQAADDRIAKINEELAKRINPHTGKPERLLPFQPLGILSLAEHSPGGFGLFDDMGLGKTVQALLSLRDDVGVIVLTRASIVTEWVDAIRRWLPTRTIGQYDGRGGLQYWPKPGQIIIGSYEVLPETPPPECPQGVTVIIDEAHNFKGAGNKRDQKWRRVRDTVLEAKGTIYPLTGTPMVNDDLDELWTVLQTARLGEREFGTKKKFKKLASDDPKEFAARLKNVSLRRLKVEVLQDLPPKTTTTVHVEITEEVKAQLDDALAKIVELAIERAEDQARKDAVALRAVEPEKLDQILAIARANAKANVNVAIDMAFDGQISPPFELIARVKSILALAKLPHSLLKLDELEEGMTQGPDGGWQRPILFFSAHVEPVRMVAKRPGWAMLTGETPIEERKQLINDFKIGKYKGFALSIRAGGEGLNLTRADRIVRNDREWTPAANEQADARAWRFGQDSPVQIFDVIGNHALDERISERLSDKEIAISSTVERAVTRINERRESLADRLESLLDGTTSAAILGAKRAPKNDHERAAIGWARTSGRAFFEAMTRQFDRNQELADKQWDGLLKAYDEATLAERPTPPLSVNQKWVWRGLLLLSGKVQPGPAMRIDGPIKSDTALVNKLADLVSSCGLTPAQWDTARALLRKYVRQIGQEP